VRAAIARLRANAQSKGRARNVLIEGDTGTGKELLAEEIARVFGRGGPHFTRCNIAALSPELFEGQLFGWEKGSFSGSMKANKGLFVASNGGAVFLDEIGELPAALQPKLLRLLENGEVLPIGSNSPIKIDVIVIAATNRNLGEQVKSDSFRLDLLSRFQVRIAIPKLSDRPEDIFAILKALWESSYGPLDRERIAVETVELLMLNDWPGNVRDMVRLLATVDPAVGLKRSIVQEALGVEVTARTPPLTREAISKALAKHNGNQTRAARELRTPRGRLIRAMKKHKLG
jgi:transcriptional regulator with PAS, ATPase and Fis domain